MSTPEGTVPLHLLLEHEPFVRSLARSLLFDEHRAEDLAQDAWVAALRSPPRPTGSVRGWFARVTRNVAHNDARGEARRARREKEAAREESARSIDPAQAVAEAHDRLLVHRDVVDAVLTLREPYKSVVVQCYYEGLSLAEIARRTGAPEGTVRSQMSRGLDQLRARLDTRYGDRRAWCVALLPFVDTPGPSQAPAPGDPGGSTTLPVGGGGVGLGGSIGLVAIGSLAVAIPLVLLALSRRGADATTAVTLEVAPSRATQHADASGPRQAELAAALAVDPAPAGTRHEAAPRLVELPVSNSALEELSVGELYQLAVRVQRRLETELLAVDGAAPTADGRARLLALDRWPHVVSHAGGGAFFSFAERTYSDGPAADVAFEGGSLATAFQTGQRGFFVPLGALALEDLRGDPARPPASHDAERLHALWQLAWADVDTLEARVGELAPPASIDPVVGHAWLLRTVYPREHDELVVLRVEGLDDGVLTLDWRRLARWPVAGRPEEARPAESEWWMSGAPAWLDAADRDTLLAMLAAIRAVARPRLLGAHGTREGAGADTLRLLFRGRYEALLGVRGGGAYVSFATLEHGLGAEPDLSMDRGRYLSGFHGAAGFLLDLGGVDLDDVPARAATVPIGLDARARDVWSFLWTLEPAGDPTTGNALSPAQRARARELGLWRRVPAVIGHTYVLRSMRPGEHDVLIAFRALAEDAHGHTLAWRTLATY